MTKVKFPEENIFKKIMIIRNQKVLMDADIASLYGVETKKLKQAVSRNIKRFPKDFMFILTTKETQILRSQFASTSWGGTRYQPMVFTEQGIAMLSSVINSPRAIAINIQIMRVFVKMRQMISLNKELLKKIEKLEASDEQQSEEIRNIYNLIKELLEPAIKNPRQIGFKISSKKS